MLEFESNCVPVIECLSIVVAFKEINFPSINIVYVLLISTGGYYTNMDLCLWWEQYGVLRIWGENIDWGEAELNIVAENP